MRSFHQIVGRMTGNAGWLFATPAARGSRCRGAATGRPLPWQSSIRLVKLGIADMSKAEQTNLWKLVDEYATVDALQEFCGTKLNLQRRAWRAVATCVEPTSLKKVSAPSAPRRTAT